MSLMNLSPELLLQICEELCQHCQEKHLDIPRPDLWKVGPSHRALHNLSLVCRYTRAVAQPVLYHHFGYVDKGASGLARFCRTICNNLKLAECLQWADLSSSKAQVDSNATRDWLADAVEKFSDHLLPNTQFWLEKCPNCALPALILLQAPNLERVDDDGKNEGVLFHMIDWETGAVTHDDALPQNLSSVWLGSWVQTIEENYRFRVNVSTKGLGHILGSLKTLRSLTIYCPWFSAIDEQLLFRHLRVLRLGEFLMRRDEFERLISCTPMLEEFAHFYFGVSAMRRGATATIPEICKILTQRRSTLRRVMLDASCTFDNIEDVRMLENLEELKIWAGPSLTPQPESDRINSQALVNALPPSLQKLHVKVKTPGLDMAGEALLTYISSTSRASSDEQMLKQVYFDVYEELARRYDPFKQALEDRCHEWARHGTVVFSVRRFAWYDMGDWGSGEGNVDKEDNRDI
ncbi:hypothetical protein NCS52_00570700 [Fusarium sp. LHS14.1]|nr:hypothetical protein NCS52_00570700 [Fusarium sp. LHS14.1]